MTNASVSNGGDSCTVTTVAKQSSVADRVKPKIDTKSVIAVIGVLAISCFMYFAQYSFYVTGSFGGRDPSAESIPILLDAHRLHTSRFYYSETDGNPNAIRTIRTVSIPIVEIQSQDNSTVVEAFILRADGGIVASTGAFHVKETKSGDFDKVFRKMAVWASSQTESNSNSTAVEVYKPSDVQYKAEAVSVSRVVNNLDDTSYAFPDFFFGFGDSTVHKPNVTLPAPRYVAEYKASPEAATSPASTAESASLLEMAMGEESEALASWGLNQRRNASFFAQAFLDSAALLGLTDGSAGEAGEEVQALFRDAAVRRSQVKKPSPTASMVEKTKGLTNSLIESHATSFLSLMDEVKLSAASSSADRTAAHAYQMFAERVQAAVQRRSGPSFLELETDSQGDGPMSFLQAAEEERQASVEGYPVFVELVKRTPYEAAAMLEMLSSAASKAEEVEATHGTAAGFATFLEEAAGIASLEGALEKEVAAAVDAAAAYSIAAARGEISVPGVSVEALAMIQTLSDVVDAAQAEDLAVSASFNAAMGKAFIQSTHSPAFVEASASIFDLATAEVKAMDLAGMELEAERATESEAFFLQTSNDVKDESEEKKKEQWGSHGTSEEDKKQVERLYKSFGTSKKGLRFAVADLEFPAFGDIHLPPGVYYIGIRTAHPVVVAGQEGATYSSPGPVKVYHELSDAATFGSAIERRQQFYQSDLAKQANQDTSKTINVGQEGAAGGRTKDSLIGLSFRTIPAALSSYFKTREAAFKQSLSGTLPYGIKASRAQIDKYTWRAHHQGLAISTDSKFSLNRDLRIDFGNSLPVALAASVDGNSITTIKEVDEIPAPVAGDSAVFEPDLPVDEPTLPVISSSTVAPGVDLEDVPVPLEPAAADLPIDSSPLAAFIQMEAWEPTTVLEGEKQPAANGAATPVLAGETPSDTFVDASIFALMNGGTGSLVYNPMGYLTRAIDPFLFSASPSDVRMSVNPTLPGAISFRVFTDESKHRGVGIFVIAAGLIGVLAIMRGSPTEIVLIVLCGLLACTGTISTTAAFSGFGSVGLVTLAAFFVIGAALRDMKLVSRLARFALGEPKTVPDALKRMALPVIVLSAVLSGPFVVTLLLPHVLVSAHRIGSHPGQLLMPLAILSALGGMCSLVGSPVNLTAFSLLEFPVGVWDFLPLTLPVAAVGAITMYLLQPTLLRSSGSAAYLADKSDKASAEGEEMMLLSGSSNIQAVEEMAANLRFRVGEDGDVSLHVANNGPREEDEMEKEDRQLLAASKVKTSLALEGREEKVQDLFARSGLEHLEFHLLFEVLDPATGEVVRDAVDVETDFVGPLAFEGRSVADVGLNRIAGARLLQITDPKGNTVYPSEAVLDHSLDAADALNEIFLQPGCGIKFAVHPHVVPFLRSEVDGLRLASEDRTVELLGGHRRQRVLAEAVVHGAADSPLIAAPIDSQSMAEKYGMVVLGVKRQEGKPVCRADFDGFQLRHGDVLLIETFKSLAANPPSVFSLVHPVPHSRPPPQERTEDRIRAVLTAVAVLGLTVCAGALPAYSMLLPALFVVLVGGLYWMKQLAYEDLYSALQPHVLLTIGAAIGVAHGFAESGALGAVARLVTFLCAPFGAIGMLCGLYLLVSGTAFCLSSCAALAIVFALLPELSALAGLQVHSATFLCLVAANTVFSTPFALPQSLVVVPKGRYSFADFMRFGGPVQLVSGITAICVVYALGASVL